MSLGLPTFRVTLLGPAKGGKTSLINAFVNNYCPQGYVPTDDPTLYYRTIGVTNPGAEGSKQSMNVLIEIEDSYASDRSDGKDCYGEVRKVNNFLSMKSQNQPAPTKGTSTGGGPVEIGFSNAKETFEAISQNRMGYLIVFDVNDRESLESATRVHKEFCNRQKYKKTNLNPVIYIVANQIDKDPSGEAYKINEELLKTYAKEDHSVTFKISFVSAAEFTGVRRLFREICDEIVAHPQLWQTEEDKKKHGVGDEEGGAGCSVQ